MDHLISKEKPKQRPFTFLAGGCLIVLFLLLISVTAIAGYEQKVRKQSATLTPTAASTQQILGREPVDKKSVLYEDFSSNRNNWELYYPNGKIEIINGKLILQSNVQDKSIFGTSERFAPIGKTYYLQADFTTDIDQALPYGLIFGLSKSLGTYYVFEIWPWNGGFRLLKSNKGNWSELIPYSRHTISPYPEPTTLSVYFDEGNMDLYINGEMVDTYSDTDFFQSQAVGVFAAGNGYRLIVDDFFVYPKE